MATATKKQPTNGRPTATPVPVPLEEEQSSGIAIDRIAEETLRIPILGISPLIMHRFSEKMKKQMLDAQQGKKSPRERKNPEAEYKAAFYFLQDGKTPAMPADAFKMATVGAARFYGKDVKMSELKQFIFIQGELGDDGRAMVAIEGQPEMREDVVRVGNGGADLRYRPHFYPWKAELTVSYVTSMLARESVISLVDAGGRVGVGDWRPERKGTFGTYRVDPDRDIEAL